MNRSLSYLLFAASIFMLPNIAIPQNNSGLIPGNKQEQNSFNEKLYVRTDKSFYLAGEIMWFKIYAIDGKTNQPVHISKLAYIEILDRQSRQVLQAKVPLTINGGEGSFYLPVTLSSDHYILRAYTNWMKNGNAEDFFEQQVTIVNTLKISKQEANNDSAKAKLAFFPEGGYLVQDVESKVGYKLVDQFGKGINAAGMIVNQNGDTVINFSSKHFGIGHFVFKPKPLETYRAIIKLPSGERITQPLPAVVENGFVLNVTDQDDGRYKIKVSARGNLSGKQGEQVTILAHTRNALKIIETGFAHYINGLTFYIDKRKLGEGVSQLTLLNENQQPVCERLVFIKPLKNTFASIKTDKNNYQKREEVKLSVLFENMELDTINYSISVYEMDGLSGRANNIQNYFWLGSELQGHIESPDFYLSNDANAERAADDLMLTHGWRRYVWGDEHKNNSTSNVKYIPEYRGHLITAKITQSNNKLPARMVECFLSVPSERKGFYAARTDSMGIVRFDVKDYYGPGDIIIQVRSEMNMDYKVELINPFSEIKLKEELPFIALLNEHADKILEKSIAMQVQNIYSMDSIRKFSLPVLTDTFPFYGKADFTYFLDSYKRFTTMEEVLREYVFPVTVVVRNGQLRLRIFDELSEEIHDDHILLLLDGVPLKNVHKIFEYDPLKIKKLEVVPRQYIAGTSWFNGIASFETYEGQFNAFELDPSLVTVNYEGLQFKREFYSPIYQNEDQRADRIPDQRSTLLWLPSLNKTENGKTDLPFFTSDRPGKYLIAMEGITSAGEIIYTTTSFTVE